MLHLYNNKGNIRETQSMSSPVSSLYTFTVKKPLFGRADNIIKFSAFDLITLKEIMRDHNPSYTNDDLLELYTFTGGVPKYIS